MHLRAHLAFRVLFFLWGLAVWSLPHPAAAQEPGAADPPVSLYGFVRLDGIFDDSTLSHPHFPMWVESEGASENNAELAIHPRLTRVGLSLLPQELSPGWSASGKIEIDFQNGGRESRPLIRMRHAFVALEQGALEILAGQTWDLISPLYPAANNDGMMWNAGNLGDRRPQVRATVAPAFGAGSFRVAAAVSMPNAVDAQDLDGDGQLDGFAAGVPLLQGLAEIRLGGWARKPMIVGVSGHWGLEALADGTELTTWSSSGHIVVPITDRVAVQGEVFIGQDLSDVRGGIGQAVNAANEEIRSAGGWAELAVTPVDEYFVAAGATLDAPDEDDLDDGQRSSNVAVYLVQRWKPWAPVQIGLEYLYWKTEYRNAASGDANRVNAHLTYTF